jgi:hypothetical protein
MKKYVALALVFAVPASAATLVFSPEAAQLMRKAPSSPGGAQGGWQPAALKDGGYARCKNPSGCHDFASNQVIANYGTVWMYQWNGQSASTAGYPAGRGIGAFWPQGQYQQPFIGSEGFVDEWEGVA